MEIGIKVQPQHKHRTTSRQRNVSVIATSIANDMDTNGTPSEQRTAALLRLVADCVERGYEGELVRVMREWRIEVEVEQGGEG